MSTQDSNNAHNSTIALVTSASSGMGKAIARQLIEDGLRYFLKKKIPNRLK